MKSIAFIFFTCLLFHSCREKKTTFIYLNKHSGAFTMVVKEYNKKVGIQYQTVLVRNPPRSKEGMKKMIINYYKNIITGQPIKSDIYVYSISFYRNTDATSYFINNKEDPGGFSSEILSNYCKEYGLGEITAKRCYHDSSKWSIHIAFKCNEFGFFDSEKITISNDCK